jgi:light-regulated signal transduction histidine kinase (bacteriophytochrome)
MFYRLHNDDEYSGAGIGLAICRKIIDDHDGQIWVDKTYSDGARIVFTLPAA